MPWKEVNPMQQRVLFIADYLRQISSLTDLCAHYGISRKTGYKWIHRFEQSGIEGLQEQSCRPGTSPAQTPYRIQQAIIELRQQFQYTPGAKKLRILLAQRYPNEVIQVVRREEPSEQPYRDKNDIVVLEVAGILEFLSEIADVHEAMEEKAREQEQEEHHHCSLSLCYPPGRSLSLCDPHL